MTFPEPIKNYHKNSSAADFTVPLLLNEGYASVRINPSSWELDPIFLQEKVSSIATKPSVLPSTSF
jgi:hypothetical protein